LKERRYKCPCGTGTHWFGISERVCTERWLEGMGEIRISDGNEI